jgi:hypothetical protein
MRGPAFVCALVLGWGLAAAPAALGDEAAALYDPGTVFAIHLTLPKTSEEELEADPEGAYQPGEFSIAATEGVPQTEKTASIPVKVEVRLKGNTSFEPLSGKAAFKLKFKKGERPFGLKKMTLNNMVQDPSMVHETLAYEEFRDAGVPAPRTGFAYVYVNGVDYGMHLDLETVDEQALEKMFGTPFEAAHQHLYEGEDGTDVIPGDADKFEVDEGSETEIGDLEALIGAVNGSGAEPWSTRVAPFADLTEMTQMWAVEKYVGQWDGYSGRAGELLPNNYYLYDDTKGVFQMIPWGADQSFEPDEGVYFEGQAGVLFDKCSADPTCFATYRQAVRTALATARALDLPARAMALDAMLAPWQELEAGNVRHHYTRTEAHAAAAATAAFASARIGEAETWLSGGEAQPAATTVQGQTAPAAAARSTRPAARLRRMHAAGLTVKTSLLLSTRAGVSQIATFGVGGKRRTACRVPARSHAAGSVSVSCHLTRAAREQLRAGPLKLLVVTTAHGEPGRKTVLRRRVTFRKR